MDLILLSLSVGAIAMAFVAYLSWSIIREPAGTPEMMRIAASIEDGAKVYLRRQNTTIAAVTALVTIPIALYYHDLRVIGAFVAGSALSLLSAYIGMMVAVKANVRTTNAAKTRCRLIDALRACSCFRSSEYFSVLLRCNDLKKTQP